MKKIIFWGDSLLAGPAGFAELLADHIFLRHPRADAITSIHRGETAWQDALRAVPMRIGEAPDLVVLGFGSADVAAGRSAGEILPALQGTVSLLLQKTQARLCLLKVVGAFFPEEAERENCRELNRLLTGQASERVTLIDLDSRVERFLAEHKLGAGDKRALHVSPARLTTLGGLFLAHHAFELIPWPDFSGPFVSGDKIS